MRGRWRLKAKVSVWVNPDRPWNIHIYAVDMYRECRCEYKKSQSMLKTIIISGVLAAMGFNSTALAAEEVQTRVPVPRPKPPLVTLQTSQPAIRVVDLNATREYKSCLASLTRRSVEFIVEKTVQDAKGCSVSHPVRLISVASGGATISLPAQPLLNCGFALRLATWLSDVAAPVVHSFAKTPLKAVATGPGYVCRTRNNQKGAKISEHGFGNAIDITGFQVAGRRQINVSIMPDGPTRQVRMLSALRTSSCGYFTTVLGPGTNAAHRSHFHLDYGKHGRSWNYRICE